MLPVRVTAWRCGQCGKPRGLHHLCAGGRSGPDRIGLRLTVTRPCPRCGKPALNPLAHTCSAPSDFRRRKAAARRADQAGVRSRKRKAAAAKKRARLRERKRQAAEKRKQAAAGLAAKRKARARQQSHDPNRHEYADCTDENCHRGMCRAYREGIGMGEVKGHAKGFEEGFAAALN